MSEKYSLHELEQIVKKPAWYFEVKEFLQSFKESYENASSDEAKEIIKSEKEHLLFRLGELLNEGKVTLDENHEGFFDRKRKLIDTIVIHHSSRPSDLPLYVINAIHLLNLYVPEFSDPKRDYYGQNIFSGHTNNGKQTFIAYHYLIMPDGEVIQNLKDEYIGWHCGNWDYNCRSIAICFHAELEEAEPTPKAILSAKKLIAHYNPKEILGHREIKPMTECPGSKFLGENGWKKKLLQK